VAGKPIATLLVNRRKNDSEAAKTEGITVGIACTQPCGSMNDIHGGKEGKTKARLLLFFNLTISFDGGSRPLQNLLRNASLF
jgi:hypothetical protein